MSRVEVLSGPPVPQADVRRVDLTALQADLERAIQGEVRFDAVSRALYSTDASVYQIEPLGVVVPRSREDIVRTRRDLPPAPLLDHHARRRHVAGRARRSATGSQLDTSKYFNRVLEVNVAERWARVEPGIVLDELNAQLQPHGLRFAPDISTASRATDRRHDRQQLERRALGAVRQDDRPRARAARSCCPTVSVAHFRPLDARGARRGLRAARRSRRACYRDGATRWRAQHADGDRPPLPEGPAARRRLQPRRVRRSSRRPFNLAQA